MHSRTVDLRYQDAEVAASYDRARFHGLRGRYNNWRLRRMVAAIVRRLGPEMVVLDMPCGTGRLERSLSRVARRVVAADISREMLAVASRKTQRLPAAPQFLQADARHLPLDADTCDVALCIRFLHLLDRDSRLEVLRELARVTARWVVVEYRNVTKPLRAAKRAVTRWFGGRPPRTITLAEIEDELEDCGLLPERAVFTSRWFSGSVVIVARNMLCAVAVLLAATAAHAEPPSLTRTDSAPVLGPEGRSLDPARHEEPGITDGLKILGDDTLYLLTSPLRPTLQGVAITAGIGAGIGLMSLLDGDIRSAAGHHRHDRTGDVADGISQLGNAPVLLGLNLAGVFAGEITRGVTGDRTHLDNALVATEAQILSLVFSEGIAYATRRATPRESSDAFTFKSGSSSFPSSHASQAFAVATVLADRYGWGVGTVAYTLATAVAGARIVQERHWASDVVAGAALGWAIGHTLSLRRAQHPPMLDFFPFADPGTKTFGVVGSLTF